MVDTLGLPTVFFTHSAADLPWPELACLICVDDPESSSARSKAVQENPTIADWFFYQCIMKLHFYTGVFGATDYWFHFKWQHHGSPHVHGLAWLPDAPDLEEVLSSSLSYLIATCQRHTCCSAAYCLHICDGQQKC